jgi:hypothetical protein
MGSRENTPRGDVTLADRQTRSRMPARFQETPDHVYGAQQHQHDENDSMDSPATGFFPSAVNGGFFANGHHHQGQQNIFVPRGPVPPPPRDSPEAIVVSGIAGRFPESGNMEEFAENLFNGVDMVTDSDRRWKPGTSCQEQSQKKKQTCIPMGYLASERSNPLMLLPGAKPITFQLPIIQTHKKPPALEPSKNRL